MADLDSHLSYPGRDPPVHVEPVEPVTSLILTGRGAKTPTVLPLKEGMTEASGLRRRIIHYNRRFVGFFTSITGQ